MSQIKDIFFIKTILDRATAGSHNGETGYYSVSDNMFSEGHSCYCDNGNDYYSDLKGIFDCATTDFSCPGFGQVELESGNYPMTIVKLAGVDHLTLLFSGITINLNFDGNYYYTQNNYSSYGGVLYRFDYVDGEIEYVKTYGGGGSYATVDKNVETTLYSSMPIMMYYNNADRNINYARIDGDQGIGPGGWQVPNPNPTRKIIINGSEPDDIKLNGVTPDKIMLNGQCYFEKVDPHVYLYKWNFKNSLVDEIQGVEVELKGGNSSTITRDSSGIHINNEKQCIYIGQMDMTGKTLEIDIPYFELAGSSSANTDFVCHSSSKTNDYYTIRSLYFTPGSGWYCYGFGSINAYNSDRGSAIIDAQHPLSYINGKILKIIYKTTGGIDVYFNDTLIGSDSTKWFNTYPDRHSAEFIYLGGKPQQGGGSGQTYNGNSYNMTITGVRIYANEE